MLVSIIDISCDNNLEEPINPLLSTWVFYSETYSDCDNDVTVTLDPSIYPCDQSSCLQVTFTDSIYYIMDVKYDTFHQKKVGKIIIDENQKTITCIEEFGGYIGVFNEVSNPTFYYIKGDTLNLNYRVEYENCIHSTILIKKK